MIESPDIRIAQLEQARHTLLAVTEQAEQLLAERDKRIGELVAEAVEHAVRHRQVYDEQARTIADLRSEVNHLSVALEAAESDLRDARAERDEAREQVARVQALCDNQFTWNDAPYREAFRRALEGRDV